MKKIATSHLLNYSLKKERLRLRILAERLKSALTDKQVKQKELAAFLKVQESTVSQWLNDVHAPDGETLSKIALFLEDSVAYLLAISNVRSLTPEIKEFKPEEVDLKQTLISLRKLLDQALANGVSPKDAQDALRYSEKLLSALQDAKTKGGNKN
mgnify:CR=1 FL=1